MPKDKQYHFLAGFSIALALSSYSPVAGLALGMLAGVVKEVYDFKSYGLFDKVDMLYTWAGAAFGYCLAAAIL